MGGKREDRAPSRDACRNHHPARSRPRNESTRPPMKTSITFLTAAALFTSMNLAALSAAEPLPRNEGNVSLRNEVLLAIDKGLAWLQQQQQADGSFANPENSAASVEHPALTALPLIAFHRQPTGKGAGEYAELLRKGYAFLRGKAQPDGGIYTTGLSNYNTSIALMALLNSGDPKD